MTMRMLCSTSSTVMPCLFRPLITSSTCSASARGSPAVGSSSKSSRGSLGERAREFEDLHFSIAECAGRQIGLVGEIKSLKQFERSCFERSLFGAERPVAQDRSREACMAAQMASGNDIFEDGHLAEDLKILKCAGDAKTGAGKCRQGVDAMAIEKDMTRGGPRHAGDHVEEGALAGAVRPDDGLDLARRHREAEIGNGAKSLEVAVQCFDLQQRVLMSASLARRHADVAKLPECRRGRVERR